MSLQSMRAELRASLPKLPYAYTLTLINRSWRQVRESNLWSFLMFSGQWIAPPQFQGISAATMQGSDQVTLSLADSANLTSTLPTQPYSLVTQRQFRIASGGIYNITGYDDSNPQTVLTLDRWYGEETTPGSAFQIYQCYYIPTVSNAPITDFKSWLSVRDMANFRSLYTDRFTRRELDMRDPQRTWYGIPTDVVPFADDATSGALTFELWGAPTFNLNYQLYGLRSGLDLALPSDTLPFAVGEDCVLAGARVFAYEWAEANKSAAPRQVGPDFRYLMGAARSEYMSLLGQYRRADRERVDNWKTYYRLDDGSSLWPFYNTQGGVASPGGIPS